MILYGFWRTSATYRVRVALALKGLHADEIQIDLDAGQQRSPEYLRINPLGGIPSLVLPGQPPLTQSLAILEYLEEAHPEPALLPSDLHQRAWVRSLAQMVAADTHPLITPRVRGQLRTWPGYDDARWKAWQTHWLHEGLSAFEARLAEAGRSGTYCLGDTLTLADICLTSLFAVMKVFGVAAPTHTPLLSGIVTRCEALEAFARADPYRQVGAPPTPG